MAYQYGEIEENKKEHILLKKDLMDIICHMGLAGYSTFSVDIFM